MGIGYRIKEVREQLGLTQTELGQKVGVTGSAITNYEKETSHPKEQVIYKLMEVLGVDANYLFQDCVRVPPKNNDINLSEYEHIKKYRDLDEHGKEMVDFTLSKEYERSKAEKKKADNVVSMEVKESNTYEVNAAHADDYMGAPEELRQQEEDIMDDENF
ncbi:MAG: helix-turn-helix domain-containing protein [Roseburia sp.]